VRALDTTCSTPVHATITKLSLTTSSSNQIIASFPDAA
jgi:hypothetical protein